MRVLLLLMSSGCAVIPAVLKPAPDPRTRPEWVDVHEEAFFEPDGKVVLVYGVGRVESDTFYCRPDLLRLVLEGRALPPMQHLLGEGETEVSDELTTIHRNGREWNRAATTRERRASGALYMVTTQGAWFDHETGELYILRRAIAPAAGLDLGGAPGVDTSSTQNFDYAMRAYLAACAPPPVSVVAEHDPMDHEPPSRCRGHCAEPAAEKPVITTCEERCRTSGPSALCSCKGLPLPPPRTCVSSTGQGCRGTPRPMLVTDL